MSVLIPCIPVAAYDAGEEWDEFRKENKWIDGMIKVLSVILLYIILRLFWRHATKVFRDELTPSSYSTLKTLGNAVIFLIALIAFATLFQSSELATALIGVSALIGTAIGFASTHTLGNLLSGLYLIITKPFRVGDYIILPKENTEGIVQELGINYTEILTIQGTNVLISNSKVMATRIVNTRIDEEDILPEYRISDDEEKPIPSTETKEGGERTVSGIFRSLRTKLREREEYLYPFVFSISPGQAHQALKVILDEVCDNFDPQTTEPMSWFLLDRNRLEAKYQLNVVVENPYDFLSLIPAIRLAIEDKLEQKLAK